MWIAVKDELPPAHVPIEMMWDGDESRVLVGTFRLQRGAKRWRCNTGWLKHKPSHWRHIKEVQ